MSDDLRVRLIAAASAGEIVRIVYHRGSQPGAVREIAPIKIADDEVKARDLAAGMDKTFKLAHIELAGPDTTARAYDPAAPPLVEITQTVRAALAPQIAVLEALGWHVELTEHRISLHRFFKNGKPRKGCEVTMGFDEFTVDAFDDGDGQGMQTVPRPSRRPYNVSSASVPTRTNVRLLAAVPLFLEQARAGTSAIVRGVPAEATQLGDARIAHRCLTYGAGASTVRRRSTTQPNDSFRSLVTLASL